MKTYPLKLTFALALISAAAAAHAQTVANVDNPPLSDAQVQDFRAFLQAQTPDANCNDFTNQVIHCTPETYTNNLAAIVADQQYRVQDGSPARGATALQSGSRIEPRTPTGYLSTAPWAELGDSWYLDNDPTR
jgi:hypothetical protein